ncbi:MAG: hypothetical protein ABSG37_01220 [Candidatus Limnocylindrales bacterium]|jgi:4-amino-4-deoxy-L-arabinose transferase-like glycosyltransferase
MLESGTIGSVAGVSGVNPVDEERAFEPDHKPAGAVPRRAASWPAGRLAASGRELACLGAILALAAALRFVNLPARGGWDSDQGTSMLDLHRAISTGQLPTFGPLSSLLTFHHGALYYDLLLPAAWLGSGDPTWVVAEIALLSLLVVPIVWWIARSIGGPAAGLTAALLAAVSASLIGYATFIWNPTLVEPGAAVAFLGAWQALRTRRAGWWVLSAVGATVAMQAHVAAAMIALPLTLAFLLDLRLGPPARRIRIVAWGLIGVGVLVVSYLPLIAYELGHNFAETRGILAYFTDTSSVSTAGPVQRLILATVRIIAWPLTRWPLVDRIAAVPVAFMVASSILIGLAWRLGATSQAREPEGPDPASGSAATSLTARSAGAAEPALPWGGEGFGVRVIVGWLLILILALGLGLRSVSEIQSLPTEQYHAIVDPLVLVAAGLVVGGLWKQGRQRWMTISRRIVALAALGLVLTWNVGHWPPLTSPDGGWPAAQAAATRLERDAGGSAIAIVPLFAPAGSDAYLYPLERDGVTAVAPDRATTVVLLCDSTWLTGCGGSAETSWLATDPAALGLTRIDRFAAAPDRIISVYVRVP